MRKPGWSVFVEFDCAVCGRVTSADVANAPLLLMLPTSGRGDENPVNHSRLRNIQCTPPSGDDQLPHSAGRKSHQATELNGVETVGIRLLAVT